MCCLPATGPRPAARCLIAVVAACGTFAFAPEAAHAQTAAPAAEAPPSAASAPAESTLPAVRVRAAADKETATSPVSGYARQAQRHRHQDRHAADRNAAGDHRDHARPDRRPGCDQPAGRAQLRRRRAHRCLRPRLAHRLRRACAAATPTSTSTACARSSTGTRATGAPSPTRSSASRCCAVRRPCCTARAAPAAWSTW